MTVLISWIRNSLLVLFVFGIAVMGCMPTKILKKGEAAETQTEPTAGKVAIIKLEMPKATYAIGEAVPVTLTLKLGKFDLLLPKEVVEGRRGGGGGVVKTVDGEEVKPNKPLGGASATKTVYHGGEPLKCIPGMELTKNSEISTSLENLSEYYPLQPGRYSLQVMTTLTVYKEIITEKSLEVQEIEDTITSIKNDTRLPADAKQDAITSLQADLELYHSDEESQEKYLPVNSRRGSTTIESNIIEFTIE